MNVHRRFRMPSDLFNSFTRRITRKRRKNVMDTLASYSAMMSGLCEGHSSSSTPNSSNHVFMDPALCTGTQSCWNKKGRSSNCCHKNGSTQLSKLY
ncbi:hypothetical protein UPYG_G00006410 [Umbra pygmaea]|uniref:Uncharacterized protein n=1 Tax=Umbra pygmaea TaxID=75934 RepID=A0ABD0XHT9_UMBPY